MRTKYLNCLKPVLATSIHLEAPDEIGSVERGCGTGSFVLG